VFVVLHHHLQFHPLHFTAFAFCPSPSPHRLQVSLVIPAPDHYSTWPVTSLHPTTSPCLLSMAPSSLVGLLGSACDAVPDHDWRRVSRDNDVSQAHSEGLGRALMFDRVRSVVFGEVDSSSLVDLVLLLELRIGDTVVDVGSGMGPFILLAGMMHPEANAIGVEVVDSRHLISLAILGGIIRQFPNFCKNVQLISGDVLDPDLDPEILFASLTVMLVSDMLFDESVHQ
jgi:hypothetical protein